MSQMNSNDKIAFCSYEDEDGKTVYGCRGIGPSYADFYNKWLPHTSYKCVREDFPWDYFIFENPEDEKMFIEEYWNNHDSWVLD